MVWTSIMQEAFFFALFGGVAAQLLALAQLRNVPKMQRPDLKDPIYWFAFIVLPLIGAGLGALYAYPYNPVQLAVK